MSPCHFHSCVPVYVAEKPETEAFRVGGVGEAIDCQRWLGGVERLSDPLVQLIVGYRAPESGFAVGNRLKVCEEIEGGTFYTSPTVYERFSRPSFVDKF